MVIARRHLIREGFVSTYHVWSRCVRKVWLQRKDFDSGRDLTHRKAWVKDRLIHLPESFWTAVVSNSSPPNMSRTLKPISLMSRRCFHW